MKKELFFVYSVYRSEDDNIWTELHSTWETESAASEAVQILADKFNAKLPAYERLCDTCQKWKETLPANLSGPYTVTVHGEEYAVDTLTDVFLATHPSVSETELFEMDSALFNFGCWEIHKITLGFPAQDEIIKQVYPKFRKIRDQIQLEEEHAEALTVQAMMNTKQILS